MKNVRTVARAVLLAVVMAGLFTSCMSLPFLSGGDDAPKVPKELLAAESIALLGYNTNVGVDDRDVEANKHSELLDMKLSIEVEDGEPNVPIGDRANSFKEDLVGALSEVDRLTLMPEEEIIQSASYAELPEVIPMDNVNVASGYRDTYHFENFMGNEDWIPLPGEVYNRPTMAKVLQETGADAGLVVVEKFWMKYWGESLLQGKKQRFEIRNTASYYFISPDGAGKMLSSPVFVAISQEQINLDKDMEYDKAHVMDVADAVSRKSHQQLVDWINSWPASEEDA